MKRTRTSKRTSGPVPTAAGHARARGGDFARIIESHGEAFTEATEHAQRLREFQKLLVGPLQEAPMEALQPGVIGWWRAVSLPGRSSSRSAAPSASGSRLYYLIVPTHGPEDGDLDSESPLRDRRWSDLPYAATSRTRPQGLLLLSTAPHSMEPLMRRFAEAVRNELDSEDG